MDSTLKAAVIALVIMAGLIFIRGVLLTPVRPGKNQSIDVYLTVSGSSPELEGTVNGLNWLLESGVIRGKLIVRLETDDPETVEQARILSESGRIKILER